MRLIHDNTSTDPWSGGKNNVTDLHEYRREKRIIFYAWIGVALVIGFIVGIGYEKTRVVKPESPKAESELKLEPIPSTKPVISVPDRM